MIGETAFARLWALPEEGTELILFAGPARPTVTEEQEIDYAMLRRKTDNTVFATFIEPWRESAGPKIKSIERVPVTAEGRTVSDLEAVAMRVTRVDGGQQQIFFVNYSGGEKAIEGRKITEERGFFDPAKGGKSK